MEEKFEYCKNCKQDIAAGNYVIHTAHCERNIQLCGLCSERVSRKEMEKHLESSHTMDVCPDCSMPMEKWMLEKHKESCPKQLIKCRFCELEIAGDCLEEHIARCGARTEKCSVCCQYIMLQNMEGHQNMCKRDFLTQKYSTCEFCQTVFESDILQTHVLNCKSKTARCADCGEIVKRYLNNHVCQKGVGSMTIVRCMLCDKKYPSQLLGVHLKDCRTRNDGVGLPKSVQKCQYCNLAVPSDILPDHVHYCGSVTKQCKFCYKTFMRKDENQHSCEKDPSKSQGTCNYCDQTMPRIYLETHMLDCVGNFLKHQSNESVSRNSVKNEAVGWNSSTQKKFVELTTQSKSFGTQSTSPFKKCKFCGERMPGLIYYEHVDTCQERPYECKFCKKKVTYSKRRQEDHDCLVHDTCMSMYSGSIHKCELCLKTMPANQKFIHEQQECKMIHGDEDNLSRMHLDKSYEREKPILAIPATHEYPSKDYLEKISELCQMCGNRIPMDRFQSHQKQCALKMKMCNFCKESINIQNEDDHLVQCLEKRDLEASVKKKTVYNQQSTVYNQQSASSNSGGKGKKNKKNQGKKVGILEAMLPNTWNSNKNSIRNAVLEQEYEGDGIPCEFCGDIYPFIHIIEHQSGCRPDLARYTVPEASGYTSPNQSAPRKSGNLNLHHSEQHHHLKTTAATDFKSISKDKHTIRDYHFDTFQDKFREETNPGNQSGFHPHLDRYTGPKGRGYTSPNQCALKENGSPKVQNTQHDHLKPTATTDFKSMSKDRLFKEYLTNAIQNKYCEESYAVNQLTVTPRSITEKKGNLFERGQANDGKEMLKEEQNERKVIFQYSSGKDDVNFNDPVSEWKHIDEKESVESRTRAGEFFHQNYLPAHKHSELNARQKNINSTDRELNTIGTERDQRKGIIQIDKDTVLDSCATTFDGQNTTGDCSQNATYKAKRRSESINSDDTTGSSDDIYLSCGEEDLEEVTPVQNGSLINDRKYDNKPVEYVYMPSVTEDSKNGKIFEDGCKAMLHDERQYEHEPAKYVIMPTERENSKTVKMFGIGCDDTVHNEIQYENKLAEYVIMSSEQEDRKNEVTIGNGCKVMSHNALKHEDVYPEFFIMSSQEGDSKNQETFRNVNDEILNKFRFKSEDMFDGEQSDDLKNKETFGSNCEAYTDCSKFKSNGNHQSKTEINISKLTHLPLKNPDCVETLKHEDFMLTAEDELKKDDELGAFLQFLENDDKVSDGNYAIFQDKPNNSNSCCCGNSVCYCAFNQQSTSSLDNTLSRIEINDLVSKEDEPKNTNHLVSLLTENDREEMDLNMLCESSALSNILREIRRLGIQDDASNSSKEEKENSDNWTKWRTQYLIDTDSD